MSLDDHSHCETCIRRTCTDADGCPMVSCEQNCGAIYHWCKSTEHIPLCPLQKVACINRGNGCPIQLFRHEQGSHLKTCPASAICCNCEWNRSPLYYKEREDVVPFRRTNAHAKYGQLDVALAMRDEKLLAEARNVPRRIRQSLRDPLNQGFPAVPLVFPNCNSNVTYSDDMIENSHHFAAHDVEDDAFNPNPPNRSPPGLSSSICDKLFRKMETGEDPAWNHKKRSATNDSDYDQSHINNNGGVPSDSTVPLNGHHADQPDYDEEKPSTVIPPSPGTPPLMIPTLSLDLTMESITRYQAKPRSMYTFMCGQVFRRDEYPWHVKNIHADIYAGLNGWLIQRCPLACYGCNFSTERLYPNTKGSRVVYSPVLESFGVQPAVDDTLLNCNALSIDKLTNDVSEKIDSNLQSLNPINDPQNSSEKQGICLIDLPFEILEHIFQFLDGFTLNHAALTCHRFREVCSNLLQTRGIVLQKWSGQRQGGKQHWYISDTVWKYTTAMSPIRSWVCPANDAIPQHLTSCRYYKTLPVSDKPILLPGLDQRFMTFKSFFHLVNRYYQFKDKDHKHSLVSAQLRLIQEQQQGELWLFPNSVSEVLHWELKDHFTLHNHLQQCSYNVRLIRTEPVQVMPNESPSDPTPTSDPNEQKVWCMSLGITPIKFWGLEDKFTIEKHLSEHREEELCLRHERPFCLVDSSLIPPDTREYFSEYRLERYPNGEWFLYPGCTMYFSATDMISKVWCISQGVAPIKFWSLKDNFTMEKHMSKHQEEELCLRNERPFCLVDSGRIPPDSQKYFSEYRSAKYPDGEWLLYPGCTMFFAATDSISKLYGRY